MNTSGLPTRPPRARVPGHSLTIKWSGERSRRESSSTGVCSCGWEESGGSAKVVRDEYVYHLDRQWLRLRVRSMSDAALGAIDIDALRSMEAMVITGERREREQIAAWTWVSPTHLRLRVGKHELNVGHYHGEGWRWWVGDMLATAELSGGPYDGIDGRSRSIREAKEAAEEYDATPRGQV